ncbi:MAG: FdhF/YdeP family oxidoreductase [Nitrospinaceae bacterium]|jgi:molybdopterin-dependent oxidoreductase alpha subunit|nr:FdhF/YdeP family oxidoreductase [Nitrospinaceae bacterium]MDP6711837.1 FdhF/YdeP family oxidoreductase [Nitrospinaceae bacterium]
MKNKRPRTAGGWGSILYSLQKSMKAGGLWAMMRALLSRNSCKSCALGMGGQRGGLRDEKGHFPAVCNKSVVAQASDMQGPIPSSFFKINSISALSTWSSFQLERAGRLVSPLICEPGDSHYKEVSWETALQKVSEQLQSIQPEDTFFYASGRSSNEAAFLLQLFARTFGTNNINNCSYYCHQASGVGLSQTLGTGTATIQLEDLDNTDLIFLAGANPASNHPRFMKILMDTRRRGGQVIVINPARELGLEKFSVPSDFRSLLFGSDIASAYIQPNIGGDIALFKGIAKALFQIETQNPGCIAQDFIANHTHGFDNYKKHIEETSWENIEQDSGLTQTIIEDIASKYARAKNVVFAWAMGLTHHAHGVDNIKEIVNLSLLRGMTGKKNAGLLPLRGHSNVQGIGSMGFTPKLKQSTFDNLKKHYNVTLPQDQGLDTLSCMEYAHQGKIKFAWNLGGNLYGSNPDSQFAKEALSKIDLNLYLNTTLNEGHFQGRGITTIILPVLARDEEPQQTTQESMFNYIRLSDGGKSRYAGPRSEGNIIADIATRILKESPVKWEDFRLNGNIRKLIGEIIPGFEQINNIEQTKDEFHIAGRILHSPEFPTTDGRASFTVCALPKLNINLKGPLTFKLMTIRSEGQFNTVVYDKDDRYRGVNSRDIIFMNSEDIKSSGIQEGDPVAVENETGVLEKQRVVAYPIKSGNVMMYYPEANVLVPRNFDINSRTPSFKSVDVKITKDK